METGSGENLSKIDRKSIGHLWRQGSGENLSKIDCKSEQGHEPDETAHGTTRCRQRDSCPCKQRTPMGHECKSKENGGVTRGQSMDHDQGRGLDLSMEFDRKRLQSLHVSKPCLEFAVNGKGEFKYSALHNALLMQLAFPI